MVSSILFLPITKPRDVWPLAGNLIMVLPFKSEKGLSYQLKIPIPIVMEVKDILVRVALKFQIYLGEQQCRI